MIRPFHIKYRPRIESGEIKVQTASGKPVRIVCWDMKSPFDEPILAVITDVENGVEREYTCNYRADGYYVGNNNNYLVIQDGMAETTPFEKALESFVAYKEVIHPDETFEDYTRRHSPQLLKIALNQSGFPRRGYGCSTTKKHIQIEPFEVIELGDGTMIEVADLYNLPIQDE